MMRKHNREGVFLPMILIILLLIAISVIILTKFGSDNRNFIYRFQEKSKCEAAAISAICEAREAIDSQLRQPASEWEEFFSSQLSAMAPLNTGEHLIASQATTRAFMTDVDVSLVAVTCLHRSMENGRAQGLFSLSVTAKSNNKKFSSLRIRREERIRFVSFQHPKWGLTLFLLPFHESVEMKSL